MCKILLPIKTAIVLVEGEQTSLADAFIQLIRLAYVLKRFTFSSMIQFQQHAIQAFNQRWLEFDISVYLLAYFLHPVCRGMYVQYIV